MKTRINFAAQALLGFLFLVFGLNGFLSFLPMPAPTAEGGAYLGALAATGYMFPLIKGTEVVAGVLLLSRRYSALALLLLAPVVVNILAYNIALDASGLPLGLLVTGLTAYLGLVVYRPAYRKVLAAQAETAPVASQGAPRQAAA